MATPYILPFVLTLPLVGMPARQAECVVPEPP